MFIVKAMLGILSLLGGNNGILSFAADVLNKSKDVELRKLEALTGVERDAYVKAIDAQIEANRAKTALFQSGLPGLIAVIAGIVLFALPTGIHYWMVILDTTGLHGGPVGSWRIAAIPGPLAVVSRDIMLSFFIAGGAVATAGTIAMAVVRAVRER
jgi:hypothetical protein